MFRCWYEQRHHDVFNDSEPSAIAQPTIAYVEFEPEACYRAIAEAKVRTIRAR